MWLETHVVCVVKTICYTVIKRHWLMLGWNYAT